MQRFVRVLLVMGSKEQEAVQVHCGPKSSKLMADHWPSGLGSPEAPGM